MIQQYLRFVRASQARFIDPARYICDIVVSCEVASPDLDAPPDADSIDRLVAPVWTQLQKLGVATSGETRRSAAQGTRRQTPCSIPKGRAWQPGGIQMARVGFDETDPDRPATKNISAQRARQGQNVKGIIWVLVISIGLVVAAYAVMLTLQAKPVTAGM